MRLLADENFNGDILRALKTKSDVEVVRVRDTVLYQAEDDIILEWASEHNYIVLTHDVNTMIGHAYTRIKAGLAMAGVFAMKDDVLVGEAVDSLLLIVEASKAEEWRDQITYLPFP